MVEETNSAKTASDIGPIKFVHFEFCVKYFNAPSFRWMAPGYLNGLLRNSLILTTLL